MKFFRVRLILALVVGITLVSVASTYFEVLAHKHALRLELQRRTAWLSKSLQSQLEKTVAGGRLRKLWQRQRACARGMRGWVWPSMTCREGW